MTERERIIAALTGGRPDRLPWCTRLDLWYAAQTYAGTLPPHLAELDLAAIHRELGVARQSYVQIARTRLPRVELTVDFDGERVRQDYAPTVRFPNPVDVVPRERPGNTAITFATPAGTCSVHYRTSESILAAGATPYLTKHVIASAEDMAPVRWILDHGEVTADHAAYEARAAEVGEDGLAIAFIERVPFQRLLLDFMGEETCFFEMFDHPKEFAALLERLTEIDEALLGLALESASPVIEYGDNVDGEITNPGLFSRYCIPAYHRAAERVHAAGKLLASHLDGDLANLVHLIPKSGLDLVESFSQEPLSRVELPDAWAAWKGSVCLWGGLPSPLFEAHVPYAEFEEQVRGAARTLNPASHNGGAILGIADQAVGPTDWRRIRAVAQMLA
jgi:hypothetical protein